MKHFYYCIFISVLILTSISITFTSCKKEDSNENQPNFINDTLNIPQTTRVIPVGLWNENLINIDTSDYTLVFHQDLLSSQNVQIGDIIVTEAGPGYLRRIENISMADGNLSLTTSFASISEAIQDGSFSIEETLTPGNILNIYDHVEGIRLDTSQYFKTGNNALLYEIDTYLDPDELVHLTGSFVINSSLSCELEIRLFKVEKLKVGFEVGEGIDLDATISLYDLEWENEIPLSTVTFNPIIAMIGPVPVVIIPELEIFAGATFSIESEVSSGVNQQLSYSAGLLYEDEAWDTYSDLTKNLYYQLPELNATASAKAYIRPQLNLMFYGVVSPYLFGEIYGKINANIQEDPWWTLYAGAGLGAGVKVEIFGNNLLNYETDPPLILYEVDILNANSNIFNQPPQLPSNPDPQNGEIEVPLEKILTWECTDPDDDPLTFDIYFGTDSDPMLIATGATEANFNPGELEYGLTYYWKILAKDNFDHETMGPLWTFQVVYEPENLPPNAPADPIPSNNSFDNPINMVLSWECTDPENDPLTFNIFLGTSYPPPLVLTNTTEFSYDPVELQNNTIYYWKIEAADDHLNVTVGDIWMFETETVLTGIPCPGIPTVEYVGKIYHTIQIGDQCWLKENLNYEVGESWCFDDMPSNCEVYGRLYYWSTIMNGSEGSNAVPSGVQGICPDGWHIPSDNEWKILEGTVDTQFGIGDPIWDTLGSRGFDAGEKLKSESLWSGLNGTDDYGFTALPNGVRYWNGSFSCLNLQAYFWTTTSNLNTRFYRAIDYSSNRITRGWVSGGAYGMAVRCLKD